MNSNSKAPRTPARYGQDDEQRQRLDEKIADDLKEIEYDEHTNEGDKYVYRELDDPSKMIRLLQVKGTGTAKIWCKLIEATFENGRAIDCSTGADLDYEALSWCWGPPEDVKYYILIEDGPEVFKLETSKNLVMGLWSLRRPDKTRLIWVDAVCIDLKDMEERNQQVRLMAAIYSCATRVCVWLGHGDDHTKRAIPFIENIVKGLQHFNALCEPKHMENWESFFQMMQNPWFSRRWVVQEIALAREAKIYCGSEEVMWRDFSNAVELFVDFENTTRRLSEAMRKEEKQYVARAFNHISALPANLLVQAKRMVFQRDWDEGEGEKNSGALPRSALSLEYLVSLLSLFENSREHDVIYALLAIAKDAWPVAVVDGGKVYSPAAIPESDQDEFPVDYERPYVDVYKDFIEFCIRHSDPLRALDIICRPWAQPKKKETITSEPGKVQRPLKRRKVDPKADPQGREARGNEETLTAASSGGRQRRESLQNPRSVQKFFPLGEPNNNELPSGRTEFIRARTGDMPLPSWITSLTEAPFASTSDARSGMNRRNADPLVGIPGDGQRRYNASQTTGIHMESLRFRKRVFQEQIHYSMYVKGFQVDQVDKVQIYSQRGGAVAQEWLELAGWCMSDSFKEPLGDAPEAFWRTIVANRGHYGQLPREYYGPACREAMNSGGISEGAVVMSQMTEETEQNYGVAQFCRRAQEVIWNRCLIKTKRGLLGLARRGVSEGDLVCILYGCSVPVILHETEKSEKQMKDEKAEDASATLEGTLLHYMKKRKLKRKYDENREKILEKPPDIGEDSQPDIKKVKYWSTRDIEAYVREWNEIGKKLKKARKGLKDAEESVQTLKEQQRTIFKTKPPAQPTQENRDNERWHKFKGECYIHGIMDGEAMKFRDNERIVDRVFELR
jgi:hypothetical protein